MANIHGKHLKNSDSNNDARQRLLIAAEQFFCEKGFDGTSIRDLTKAADCNVASVNYHFGSKDNLYQEVFQRHLVAMRDIRIESINRVMSGQDGEPDLENLIRAFSNAFLEPLLHKNYGRYFIKLMTREMIDQKLPHGLFLEEFVIPITVAFSRALTQFCPALNEEKKLRTMHSVIGQLVHTIRIKEMFENVDDPNVPPFDLAKTVDHIVDFSVGGILALNEEKTK